MCRGKKIGIIGELHPTVLKNYSVGAKAYIAVLDIRELNEMSNNNIQYKALPKFPAVTRDMALIADDAVTVGEIEKIIKKCSGKILEDVKLFDVYKGEQIEKGKKSLAFSVIYRADDRTLTDDEISAVFDKTIKQIAEKTGAQLR